MFWYRPRGNVLSISLLVSGVIAVTLFSFATLVISDIKISSQLEDSQVAYQAASAGVELALLYYRYNHNSQLSSLCPNSSTASKCPTVSEPTLILGQPVRVYLDRLGCDAGVANCNGVEVNTAVEHGQYFIPVPEDKNLSLNKIPRKERVVDIKIWYKDSKIGNKDTVDLFDDPNNPLVKQDEIYEIFSLKRVDSLKIYLRPEDYVAKRSAYGANPPDPNNRSHARQFWLDYCINSSVTTNKNDRCFYYLVGVPYESGVNKLVGLRDPLKPGNTDGLTVHLNGKVDSLRVRPINMNMRFAVDEIKDKSGQPVVVDTGITHIESVGYYGQAKRKLEITINRKENAFMAIFDRALSSATGSLEPN